MQRKARKGKEICANSAGIKHKNKHFLKCSSLVHPNSANENLFAHSPQTMQLQKILLPKARKQARTRLKSDFIMPFDCCIAFVPPPVIYADVIFRLAITNSLFPLKKLINTYERSITCKDLAPIYRHYCLFQRFSFLN